MPQQPFSPQYFAALPTRWTLFVRVFFPWQFLRFVWINLKMIRMIHKGHHPGHLLDVSSEALDYISELRRRDPVAAAAEVRELHRLLQAHGPDAMRAAFSRALADRAFEPGSVSASLRSSAPASPGPAARAG
jgi:hypothetical protein